MEGQKKRTPNFTRDEKRIISELVLKYQTIVENKRTDATTNSEKLRGWIGIAEEFNSISTHCHRTHTELKCCWENIKRQTKKDRADRKKKLFMTGGGKPPSPPPSNQGSEIIVEAILGPALEGSSNIYDSDAVINEIIDLNSVEKENKLKRSCNEIIDLNSIEKENKLERSCNESIETIVDKKITIGISTEEDSASNSKCILKESDVNTWSSWTPNILKTPVSGALRDDRFKRRRPKNECPSDILTKEKLKLVHILQENAVKESNLRLAILEEQLSKKK